MLVRTQPEDTLTVGWLPVMLVCTWIMSTLTKDPPPLGSTHLSGCRLAEIKHSIQLASCYKHLPLAHPLLSLFVSLSHSLYLSHTPSHHHQATFFRPLFTHKHSGTIHIHTHSYSRKEMGRSVSQVALTHSNRCFGSDPKPSLLPCLSAGGDREASEGRSGWVQLVQVVLLV